jgi:N4-gp56 family major capsid protein
MYFPASNLTSGTGLNHLASVYYDRLALTALRKKFMFWKGVDTKTLPMKNGKTIQFYRYSQFGSNTTATEEGSPGTGISLTSSTVSATVAQYADFISFSDMLVDTAIDGDIVARGADNLGYRAGLTFDTIIRNEVDSVAASIDVAPLDTYFSSADVAAMRTRFAGLDIRPFADGTTYRGLIHPYTAYDFLHDPQVGGFVDVAKQSGGPGQERFTTMEDRGYVATWGGVQLWESTNVTLIAGSPNQYRSYFFGLEGLAAIDLAGRGPTRTEDQDQQKFSVTVLNGLKPDVANPEGKIKALCSYNCVFVAKTLDTNPYRMRKIDVANSLGL